jgi:hypothetical protein
MGSDERRWRLPARAPVFLTMVTYTVFRIVEVAEQSLQPEKVYFPVGSFVLVQP